MGLRGEKFRGFGVSDYAMPKLFDSRFTGDFSKERGGNQIGSLFVLSYARKVASTCDENIFLEKIVNE